MQDGTIGRRYARALAVALEEEGGAGALSDVEEQLSATAALLDKAGHADFREAMLNPSFSLEDRKAIVDEMAKAHSFHETTRRLLALLIEKDRVRYLPAIARAFRAEVDERVGRVRAVITSARALEGKALENVVKALEKKTGKQVLPEVKVDPAVISGVSARIGGQVFDNTVKTQLDRMRTALGVY